jgi:hypothetical protein
MSSVTPNYTASVSANLLDYIMKYATGNDGCIQSMTASFQPSGQSVTGSNASSSQSTNAGFFFQPQNVPQGVGINIVFYSLTIPEGTFLITLSFTTTQGNTYQLVTINTLPPNANYALVIIVGLTVTAQISQYVNVQALLQAFTAFASSQCQSQSQPQISYSGNSFSVIYQYSYVTGASFDAFLIAVNSSQSSSSLQVTVAMGGNTVVTATINTPGSEYAYFLFTVSLVFSGG